MSPFRMIRFLRLTPKTQEALEWFESYGSAPPKKNGKAIGGLGSYELVWHTDMSYNPLPPRASLLYALEVPPDGGNTGFLNMYAAYDTLSRFMIAEAYGRPQAAE